VSEKKKHPNNIHANKEGTHGHGCELAASFKGHLLSEKKTILIVFMRTNSEYMDMDAN
jgi:hydroxymethylpyrimidine/phosphomethylpyrimidine kinase